MSVPLPNTENSSSKQAQNTDSVREFIFERFPACKQTGLQDTDSLIDSGIVDSMAILEVVAFIESDFGVLLEDTDLTPDNFESIAVIADFVTRKQQSAPSR